MNGPIHDAEMVLDDAVGLANSEDLDKTAPSGAVLSGSALFANTSVPLFRVQFYGIKN